IFYGTTGAIQEVDNTNVCFCIIEGDSTVLVEASGTPARYLLKTGVDASALDALVITHAHPDHMYALPSLVHNLWLLGRRRPLRIFCNPETEEKARELIDVFSLFERKNMFPMEWVYPGGRPFKGISGFEISLFPVNHPVSASGLKIKTATSSLVYSSDTAPSERLVEETRGARALIHESTGDEKLRKKLNEDGHSTAGQAGEAAQRAGAADLFLCHFDLHNGPALERLKIEAEKTFKGNVIIPELFRFYEV
ncbi:MAG: MBL fold metallo-hydrolase, partial [Deltaproteobacteria bacterium]|nr:MBL fold metallo-hydrolase [Deltaproteobacteria bacterium]